MEEFRIIIRREPRRLRRRRGMALLGLLALAGAASAHAGLSALVPDSVAPIVQAPLEPAATVTPDDHAAPAPGVTGTAPLPALPVGAQMLDAGLDGTVIAAAPTVFRGRTALDGARALECLTAGIYYEAASESDDGQRAVAQVILNRVRHPAFPNSVCGVVYQGSERASGCQFSFSCDGAMARLPSRTGWARAARIAAAALAGSVYAPVGLATHYHTYAVTPAWNKGLVMTDAIGAHFFHRWKGWWGTPAAFAQKYAGTEPQPGPKRPIAAQLAAMLSPDAMAALAVPLPAMPGALPVPAPVAAPTPPSQIQSDYVRSGEALPGTSAAATPESQIRDEYRDSGSWIAPAR